ncbi:MAG TPA: MdtA/MuxA family multidrug efflux RND transporter periplasmic adaptor subunit [Rudaea sp.]|jgi:multidrug efflux system membrane fusion protein|nr:MdtA/MuxA family multidrug efflux RND transporter periplasmic adaptor subunit [Rudaea sp.]
MSIDSPDRASTSARPRGTKRAMLIVLVVAVLLAIGGYWLAHSSAETAQGARGGGRGGRGGPGGAGGPGGLPMPVGVAQVANGDINITLNALGTVTPLRSVTITAQVAGNLLKVNFKEGQMVKEGDALAEIDPRPYQAQLTQYEGALARDEALLANSKIDLDRYTTLFAQDSIAKQQLDSQKSLVHQYEGTVKSDQGQIDNAKVNISYTKITAPVTGRVGLRQVDPGNNVSVGSAIVVITQLKPIDVLFTIPEDNLPPVLKKMHAGDTLSADAYDRAGTTKLTSGSLASLDNQVDTSTGTVKAKSEFANDDESLFPNQFVNVHLLLDVLRNAIVIPTSALERGSDGLFVYVVQPDHTVQVRNIKTGPTEGEKVAVTDGLKVGETVVTSGADRLRDGSKVELPGEEPAPAQKPADAQKRQWNRGDNAKNQGGQNTKNANGQHRTRDANGANGPSNDPNAPAQAPGSNPSSPPPSNSNSSNQNSGSSSGG